MCIISKWRYNGSDQIKSKLEISWVVPKSCFVMKNLLLFILLEVLEVILANICVSWREVKKWQDFMVATKQMKKKQI